MMNNDETLQTISIVSMTFPKEVPEFFSDTPIKEKLEKNCFPTLSDFNFNVFGTSPEDANMEMFLNMYRESNIAYKIDYDCLQFFCDIKSTERNIINYISYHALLSYISWLSIFEKDKSYEGIEFLIKVLTLCIKSDNKEKCITALKVLLRAYLKSPTFNSDIVINLFTTCFSLKAEDSMKFSSIIFDVLGKIAEIEDMANYEKFLALLANNVNSWTVVIKERNAEMVLNALNIGLLKLNTDAIKLLNITIRNFEKIKMVTTQTILTALSSCYEKIDFNVSTSVYVLPKMELSGFPIFSLDTNTMLLEDPKKYMRPEYIQLSVVKGKENECSMLKELITSYGKVDNLLKLLKDYIDTVESHQERMNTVAIYCDLLKDMKMTHPQSLIFYQVISSIGFFLVSLDLSNFAKLLRLIILSTKSAGFTGISLVLKSCKSIEIMYTILFIIYDNFEHVSNEEITSRDTILSLFKVFHSLKSLVQNSSNKMKRDDKITTAIYNMFLFISRIMKRVEFANVWMSFSEFDSVVISLLIDDFFRPQMKEILLNFIFDEKSDVTPSLTLSFCNLFEMILKDMGNKHSVLIGYEVLSIINECCEKRASLIRVFQEILLHLKLIIQELNQSDEEYNLFIEILKFVKFYVMTDFIDSSLIRRICKKSKLMTSVKYFKQIQDLLMGIAMHKDQDVVIKNGSVLTAILIRNRTDEEKIEFIREVTNIVKYSLYNTIAVKESKFDEYLLSMVSDYAYDEENHFSLVDCLFNFLSIVHCRTATASVVSKYIGLICPLQGKYIHPCIKVILNQISGIVTMSNSEPICFIPITKDSPQIELKPYNTESFPNSFIVCILAFIEPFIGKEYQPLFTMTDNSKSSISIGVDGKELVFTVTFGKNVQRQAIKQVPIGRWTWINTSVVAHKNTIMMSVLDGHHDPVQFTGLTITPESNFTIYFGSHTKRNNDIPIAYISAGEVIKIGASPPNCNHINFNTLLETRDNILAGFSFRETNKRLDPLPINANARVIGCSLSPSTSFGSVFEHVIGISFLLIVMIEVDMKTAKNQPMTKLEFSLLDALTMLLSGHQVFQEEFINAKGCEIFNYLLGKCDSSHITFELFNKFLILQKAVQNKELSKSILSEILLDIDIWSKAAPDHFYKITKVWVNLFNKENKDCFFTAIPIALLLQEIIVLMSSQEETIRHTLVNLSVLAEREVLYDDTSYSFICLIGEIISSTDQNQAQMSTTILRNILLSEDLAQSHVKDRQDCFFLLQKLLALGNSELFLVIVDCIILSHAKGVIVDTSLQYHLALLRVMVLPENYNTQTLSYLIIKAASTPELIPFINSFTHCIGNDAYDLIANQIALTGNMNTIENIVYLAEMFAKAKKESHETFFEFLDQYAQTSFSILQIGNILGVDLMASEYAMHIITKSSKERKVSLLENLFAYILFTSSKERENEIIKIFQESPFAYKKFEEKEGFTEERILRSPNIEVTFSYRPRIVNGVWIDEDIAIAILDNYTEKELSACPLLRDLTILTLARYDEKKSQKYMKYVTTSFVDESDEEGTSPIKKFAKATKIIEELSPDILNTIKISLYYLISFVKKQEKAVNESMQMTKADSFIDGYLNALNEHLSVRDDQVSMYKEYWNELFREMTQENTPWYNSLVPESERSFHQMRDDIIVHNVNRKLVRNLDFDDHLLASTIRDAGGQKEAQEILKSRNVRKKISHSKKITSELIEPVFTNKQGKSNTIRKAFECQIILTTGIKKGMMEIYDHSIKLLSEDMHQVILNNEISQIFLRNYLQKPTAIEIFLKSNFSFFINFEAANIYDIFRVLDKGVRKSSIINKPLRFSIQNNKDITSRWVSGKITNFEYLMELNKISGRSFNDTAQYPFLPWVISNYTTEELNLNDPTNFRDLTKPIGALNEKRLSNLKTTADIRNTGLPEDQWYLYQTGPICPMQVFGYLVRMEPFTSQHIAFQGGKFDKTSRIFKSIELTYKMCTTHPQCFYELIPEFFTTPEFLVNFEHYDLGTGDNGDVKLPPWAETPYDFIYLNRKALESDIVSESLNAWIDLVWGVNQNGPEARNNDNVFDPAMYETAWSTINENDPNDLPKRIHIETTLKEVGQIPPQLFSERHKKRNMKEIISARRCKFNGDPAVLQLQDGDIVLGYTTFTPEQEYIKVSLLSTDNVLHIYKITYDPQWSMQSAFHLLLLEEKMSVFEEVSFTKDSDNVISAGNDQLVCFDEHGTRILCENTKTKNVIMSKALFGEIEKVSSDDNIIISCCNDGTAQIWDTANLSSPLFVVKTYGDEVICCSVDSSYDLAVIGTESGKLHYISLRHRCIGKTISFNEGKNRNTKIKNVYISPGWGFVLVYVYIKDTEKYGFLLYSLNGEFIRKCELPEAVSSIVLWSDDRGFDYCAFSTLSYKIYMFELFYLNVPQKFMYWSSFSINKLECIPSLGLIVCIGKNGSISLVNYL